MQAPRYTYLPLLIPEIRENLVELALDDAQLAEVDEGEWWFEEEVDEGVMFANQGPCKWCVLSLPLQTTYHSSIAKVASKAMKNRADVRHWPLDLIELHSTISRPYVPSPASSSSSTSAPSSPRLLRLILHLSGSPAEKLLLPNNVEACKTQFLNQLKEADFVRWRNTNKVTSLRRADLEAGWDGIVQGEYFVRTCTLGYGGVVRCIIWYGHGPVSALVDWLDWSACPGPLCSPYLDLTHPRGLADFRRLRPLYAYGEPAPSSPYSPFDTSTRTAKPHHSRPSKFRLFKSRVIIHCPGFTDEDLSSRRGASDPRSGPSSQL